MEQEVLSTNYISPNMNPYHRSSPHELSINTNRENTSPSLSHPLQSPTPTFSSFHASVDQSYQLDRQSSYFRRCSQESSGPPYTSSISRYDTNVPIQPTSNVENYQTFQEAKTNNISSETIKESLNIRKSNAGFTSNDYSEYRNTSYSSVTGSDEDTEYSQDSHLHSVQERKSLKMSKAGKAAKSLLSNTEKCKVCLAQAARHVHYGSTTCYSCKAFFRRSIQLGAAFKYTCQTQGNCVMLPNTRKSCQRCRFDRCLAIGMKPDRVLTEKQRAKRFRKVREKNAKGANNNNNDEISLSTATKNLRYPNSPSPSGSLSDGGNTRSQNVETDQARQKSVPRQRPFLDDWFFDNDFYQNEDQRERISHVKHNVMAQKKNLIPDERKSHNEENIVPSKKSIFNLEIDSGSKTNEPLMQIKSEPMDSNESSIDQQETAAKTNENPNNLERQIEPFRSNHTPPAPIKTEKEEFVSQIQKTPSGRTYEKFYGTRNDFEDTRLSPYPQKKLKIEDQNRPIDMSPTSLVQSLTIDVRYPMKSAPSIPPLCPIGNGDKYSRPQYLLKAPNSSRSIQPMDRSNRTLPSATTYNRAPVSSIIPIAHSASQRYDTGRDVEARESDGVAARLSTLFIQAGNDDIRIVEKLVTSHEIQYKSISFGEDVIKEMIMSSVFGIPVSAKAAMAAYRLMIQRVTRVAQSFNDFLDLPAITQTTLLKDNADMIVSLRGAVFFEIKKQGLDQILSSLGIEDLQSAREMIFATLKCQNTLKRIDYKTFNTIQDKTEGVVEKRYDQLLAQIGTTIAFNQNLVILFSYILLFYVSGYDCGSYDEISRGRIIRIHDMLIGLMERYLFAIFDREIARGIFSAIMKCVDDLRELTMIKKKRQISASLQRQAEEDPI